MGLSVISLFAGIGGFDLGFERAGYKIIAHVEKDGKCRKLLAGKWPKAVALKDVCTAGGNNLPPCDVVTFGFPCQDLSVAGKRAGLAGGRSGLFYEATRIINELKPAYFLFENVPGLLSSDGGRDFARVLMEMDRIGYNGAWRVLDAQWLGVAQRRRRVFGLFSRLNSGAERCAEILSLPESLRRNPAPSRETGKGVAGTLESHTTGGGFPSTDGACANHIVPVVAGCITSRDAKSHNPDGSTPGHLVPVFGFGGESDASSLSGSGDLQPPITGRHGAPGFVAHPVAFDMTHGDDPARLTGDKVNTLQGRMGTGGNQVPCVAQVQWASGGGKVHNPTAQALRSGAEHNYQFAQVGMQVRRLTPTECERLQGFPDGWTQGFSDSTRYKMLGNAVCVNVSEWIAKRLYKNMTEE